jgi:basic amino acid/polyamine antiporter, APA family
MRRLLGAPFLFAVAYSAVGFSVYFAIGVVADRGLGLTPLIFLGAGVMFVLTTLTYVEGSAMFAERGGSTTFARHAFNELVSFIAGWAILIDYLIVIALAAVTVPHYLTPVDSGLGSGMEEIVLVALVVALTAALNIAGITGRARQGLLVILALADLALQLAVIVAGAIVVFEPSLLTAELGLFSSPSVEDIVYAAVIATVAFAGIEAASDLAPDLEFEPRDLRRVLSAGAVVVPLLYAGIAAVALMAVPVTPGPGGPETDLAGPLIEAPVLGVVQSYEPAWLADAMQWCVVAVAVPVLVWAANTAMLGLSRHIYVLATNRQIPSWLGHLSESHSTPFVAILISSALVLTLALPGDIEFLAGIYAFGATLAITIAHLSIIRLRVIDPDRARPFRVPLDLRLGGRAVPAPAVFSAVLTALAFVSVLAFHSGAALVGGGWMAFGLVAYVIYRRLVEGTSLTKRVTVPEEALFKHPPPMEYARILVPVFGTALDDDIVATAGRLTDAEVQPGSPPPRLEIVYVAEAPLTVPLDAPLPRDARETAERVLERGREVGEEYESVQVETTLVRARSVGGGIVDEARKRGTEVIVMGGEPPSRIQGGAILGGIGAARPDEVGPVTEYVLRKAPCRVLVTAPPEEVAHRA